MTFIISAPQLTLSRDERAYIEFSLFSAARSFEPRVRLIRADISVRRTAAGTDVVACAVCGASTAGPIVARGSSDRLYGAVDMAAQRLALAAEAAFGGALAAGRSAAVSR